MVEKLKEYWKVKSLMLQVRANPGMLKDIAFQQEAVSYVKDHTDLTLQPFWKTLSAEAQLKACQFFIMQEMNQTTYTRIDNNQDKAAIYIVLSGMATVKQGENGEERKLNAGGVFGATSLFEKAAKDPEGFKFSDDVLTNDNETIRATLEKGTYMRISLYDFHKFVLQKEIDEELKNREEESKISGIKWEDLTDDDKFYVRVYKRTRALINRDLFLFLDSYKLIPKNARTYAYRFYREGRFGRELAIQPDEALHVHVIIDGGVRIDIEAKRASQDIEYHQHALSCRRKGKKPMVITVSYIVSLFFECMPTHSLSTRRGKCQYYYSNLDRFYSLVAIAIQLRRNISLGNVIPLPRATTNKQC
jgi:hypothetical protein